MPITIQIDKEEYLAHPNDPNYVEYTGDLWSSEEWLHHFDCPEYRKNTVGKTDKCIDKCHKRGPTYLCTTHHGIVLELREYNERDDSDFYVLVWDEATQKPKKVNYATTAAWTYLNTASVDATEEVKAKYALWVKAEQDRIQAEENEKWFRQEALQSLLDSLPGIKVNIIKGKYRNNSGVARKVIPDSFRSGRFVVCIDLNNPEKKNPWVPFEYLNSDPQ